MNAVAAAEGSARYAERMKRVMDAVELRQPDRVPTVFFSTFWTARYGGISYRQAMYDYQKMSELTKRAVLEFQPDLYTMPHQLTLMGPIMDALGYKQLQWPGHGTDQNTTYQYLDHEYMKADEYDDGEAVDGWLNLHGAGAVIVRPDRYVFGTAHDAEQLCVLTSEVSRRCLQSKTIAIRHD